MNQSHDIAIVIGGKRVDGWNSYEIHASMLDPADSFQLARPFTRDAWDLLKPDRQVRIFIDSVNVLTGFTDDLELSSDDVLTTGGRCKIGRLVQESVSRVDFRGLTLLDIVAKVAEPWFTATTLSNESNRLALRGNGRKVEHGTEPALRLNRRVGTRTDPGQTRWAVIEDIVRQVGLCVWSSGDGAQLIVSRPNYSQAVQWRFFRPQSNSTRSREGNVLECEIKFSTGDRYSKIVVVGGGHGDSRNYGDQVTSRYGEAKNNPATQSGEGIDFSAPKRLVMVDSVQSRDQARAMAETEMAKRDASGHVVTVRVSGHGQRLTGERQTIFAVDTLAHFEDEATGTKGVYLVTEVSYSGDRRGEQTQLTLVPKGTIISP